MGKELKIFAVCHDLINYIGHVTEKMPKKYRNTYYVKLNNAAFEYLECLTMANSMNYMTGIGSLPVYVKRRDEQYMAMGHLRMIEQMLMAARAQGDVITVHQHEVLGQHLYENIKLLVAWGKSDRKRFLSMTNMCEEEQKRFDSLLEQLEMLKIFSKD